SVAGGRVVWQRIGGYRACGAAAARRASRAFGRAWSDLAACRGYNARSKSNGACRRLYVKENRMSSLPPCPQCKSTYTYEDGPLLICPECAHEWNAAEEAQATQE